VTEGEERTVQHDVAPGAELPNSGSASPSDPALMATVGPYRCAVPIREVVETMRPLPVEPLPGVPAFVRGAAVIRGTLLPVIDVAHLLGVGPRDPGRFVTIRAGERCVALSVDGVVGVRDLRAGTFDALPPVLADAEGEVVTRIGLLDTALLLVLSGVRIVPDDVWGALDERPATR
jgi:purine-binding chemotaxis protein CheW